jgi:DNA ligase-1
MKGAIRLDFKEIANDLAIIANTRSTLMKESMLKKYGTEVEGFKEVLKFIYDPYFTTGLGQKKLDRAETYVPYDSVSVVEIMKYLHKNCTGTDYDAAIANQLIYQSDDPAWQWAATGLVTKDLQIGVSVTTLNKVYGDGFIAKIGIMRGTLCPENARGTYIATEKIDGNRRLIMNKPTGVEIYTRSGKRDYGLVEIEAQAARLPKGFVYDTECVAVGDFADNIELRQASASILNSRGLRTGVKALCFDMLTQEEYDAGVSKMAAVFRKYLIATLFGDLPGMCTLDTLMNETQREAIKVFIRSKLTFNEPETPNITGLPILGIAHNKDEGIALAQPIWETGGEGVMLVDYKSPYEVNPNPRKTLLKIKATQEFTLLCTGVEEGSNKYTGMLGAIWVEYTRPGDPMKYAFKVGSGFPDYLRMEYWQHPEKIMWHKVEIESFGESRNAQGVYALNCPIFKRIVGEVE